MNKLLLQTALCVCLVLEGYLIFNIFLVTDVIYNALYTGLAIMVLLTSLRLLNLLNDTIYGDDQKN